MKFRTISLVSKLKLSGQYGVTGEEEAAAIVVYIIMRTMSINFSKEKQEAHLHAGLNGHLSILAHTGSLIFAFLKSLNTV